MPQYIMSAGRDIEGHMAKQTWGQCYFNNALVNQFAIEFHFGAEVGRKQHESAMVMWFRVRKK